MKKLNTKTFSRHVDTNHPTHPGVQEGSRKVSQDAVTRHKNIVPTTETYQPALFHSKIRAIFEQCSNVIRKRRSIAKLKVIFQYKLKPWRWLKLYHLINDRLFVFEVFMYRTFFETKIKL